MLLIILILLVIALLEFIKKLKLFNIGFPLSNSFLKSVKVCVCSRFVINVFISFSSCFVTVVFLENDIKFVWSFSPAEWFTDVVMDFLVTLACFVTLI